MVATFQQLKLLFGQPIMLIKCEIEKAQRIAAVESDHLEEWAPFAAKVRNMAAVLALDETKRHLENPVLLDMLVQKIPPTDRLTWADITEESQPNIEDFSNWVTKMARRASRVATLPYEAFADSSQRRSQKSDRRPGKSSVLLTTNAKINRIDLSASCSICGGKHTPKDCRNFKDMNVSDRWAEVRKKRLCFSCLKGGHSTAICRTKVTCSRDNCTRKHHEMLHEAAPTEQHIVACTTRAHESAPIEQDIAQEVAPTERHIVAHTTRAPHHATNEPNLLVRIVPVTLRGANRSISTFAMLDDAATVTLIDESVAKELELTGDRSMLSLSWYGDTEVTEPSQRVALNIRGVGNNASEYKIDVRTVRKLELERQTLRMNDLHTRYRHIKHLPIDGYEDASPTILIGLDNNALAMPRALEIVDEEGLVATKTRLGRAPQNRRRAIVNVTNEILVDAGASEADTLSDLHELVREFHTTESFGVRGDQRMPESSADARANRLLRETTIRRGEQFETGLLWARDDVSLPPSRSQAVKRLLNIESKMRSNPSFAELYEKNITNYIKKGFAVKLTPEEAAIETPRTWYLPHFGVENINKPGKLRLVFDAAATVRGRSLNTELLTGPDVYASLPKILFCFRIGAIGVCGDIQEMFHQITIRKEDRDAQRFLWRHGDQQQPMETYVMRAMTFGARCSPCSAQFVKNLNASEHANTHPEAVDAIINRHYVDDYVASFATVDDATQTTKAVIDINRRGHFNLRNFRSNSKEVLHALGSDDVGAAVDLQMEASTEKILGMYWDTATDEFTFSINLHRIPEDVLALRRRPSKRQMLSVVMSIFDPFGLLCDIMLHAKIMVQDVWRIGCGWDELVPQEIFHKWSVWLTELKEIKKCRVPRCYSQHMMTTNAAELHIFADASEMAFAAVAYWRIARPDGQVDIAFVAGKTRCAPVKLLSIPRLELQAAVLAVRLRQSIEAAHPIKLTRVVFWSDSTTVLSWIRSDHRRYKPFVGHRIAEILESTAEREWRYIPTAENVADDATRAKNLPKFDPNSRWLRGPEFLRLDETQWPQPIETAAVNEDEELRAKFVLACSRNETAIEIDVSRFSKFTKLVRTVAWLHRYCANLRSKDGRRKGELSADEIRKAEEWLFKYAQEKGFPHELRALKRGKKIESTSNLFKLLPYLDTNGVMRMNGRTDAAEHLPEDARRPILLPKDHAVTGLIVDRYHRECRHQNHDAVVCAVRQRFWVPQLRSLVKKKTGECQFCKVRGAKPSPPIMGPLPKDRLTPFVRPFSYTGLDYFGPITVTIGRRHEKRWVALFTCLTTRAVHLELAADLTSDACLLCIRNFMNLRGVPVRIRSDNGTNFVGADKILRDISAQLNDGKIERELATKSVQWLFNSPSHPEAGGCWERLVRCVKRVLAVTLNEVSPRVETLRSLLLEAANIINSRPLTDIPVDPETEEPLTANHFLLGCPSQVQTVDDDDGRNVHTRKQFRIAEQLRHRFWCRWIKEYLPDLTRRTKWCRETTPLQVGDLVLICDETMSCNRWRRGRVQQTHVGRDGRIRNVVVKTSDGELRRPVSRLAKLDVEVQV